MYRIYSYAVSLFAALLLSGCSRRAATDPAPGEIRIEPSILTRAAGLYFEENDCIGLTVTRASGDYVRNGKMTYKGSAFVGDGLTWYGVQDETSTLTAYYPYAENGVDEGFSVAADQRGGCEASDLLGAVKENVLPASGAVKMIFHHLLSQLTVVVDNSSSSAVSEVVVSGFVPTATVDLASLSVTAREEVSPADVTAFEETPDKSYRLILVPQQRALTVTVFLEDGSSREKTLSETLLEGGKHYDLSVTLTDQTFDMTLSGEIGEWVDGGSLGGGELEPGDSSGSDVSDSPGSVLEYAGERYATTTVGGKTWMAENLRYLPESAAIGAGVWYPGDESQTAALGLLYDYATATAGASSASGAPIQGICPSGWHLPTQEELEELEALVAEASADFVPDAGFWKDGGYNTSASYLLGGDATDAGYCRALKKKDQTLSVSEVQVDMGLSVRCVKD